MTVGRRSGRPRMVRLWFAAVGDRVFLLAQRRDQANWVRNLRAQPNIQLSIRDRTFVGSATILEGTDADGEARAAVAGKYGTKWLAAWLRESLAIAVDLERNGGDQTGADD